jgi:alkylhydroperoxidase/carboxymuconolactone decarboxylase family protein YurZ/quinol monooxygenase YgiN
MLGFLVGVLGYFFIGANAVNAHTNKTLAQKSAALNTREIALVRISAHTATGNLEELDTALRTGLDAGLTVNQIKTAVEQLYAYCGFPRSLNGINTLRAVVGSREKQGVRDKPGQSHQPIVGGDRYERGRATLEELTGVRQSKPAPGFGEFSPEIDRFLKEHLFADIFDNKILTYRERELVTIAALTSMSGVVPQLKSHIGIGRNTGITDEQLVQITDIIDSGISRTQANQLRQLIGKPELPVVENDMLVRISEMQIMPESSAEYLAILEEEARKSVELEPGVISIFPMLCSDDPSQVRIVEVYRNRSAYEAHIASLHFQRYKTSTKDMVKSLRLVDMQVIDPELMQKIFEKLK